MSLRLKTIVGIAFIEGVLLILLVLNAQHYLRESNVDQFRDRASTSATLFASATRNAVIATDLATLENFVLDAMRNPGLTYARVRGQGNVVLAQAGDEAALSQPFNADQSLEEVDDNRYDVTASVEEAGIEFGHVELGFDTSSFRTVLRESRNTLMALAAVEIVLVALFSYLLGTFLTRQLDDLKAGAREISRGNFGFRIPEKGKDELAQAAHAFNLMSENLKRSELRRSAYLQSPLQAVFTLDAEGLVDEVNGAAEILLLSDRDQLIGTHVLDALKTRQGDSHPLELFAHPGSCAEPTIVNMMMESVFLREDGIEFNCAWHMTTLSTDVETVYIIFAENIDERKRGENELIESRREALAASEAKTEFLGNMTHELRTPLQGIIGFSDLGISRGDKLTPEKTKKYFSTIRASADTLLSLVNNLLDLTKLEAGKMDFAFQQNDLRQRIDSTVASVSGTAKMSNISIEVDAPETLPCIVDGERIEQVLRNLLGNAIKFSDSSSVVSLRAIKDSDSGTITVQIIDAGPGIPAGEETMVFERFSQSTATKTAAGGTGLGLPICKEIITQHQGHIAVSNNSNSGATFEFTLPATLSEDAPTDIPLLNDSAKRKAA